MPFESEYDASQLPAIDGQPLGNKDLDDHVGGMAPWQRVELAQQTLVIDAVESYYLAKRFREKVLPFDAYTNAVVGNALKSVADRLMRLAVVAIASVNDRQPRTRSLPQTLDALAIALAMVADVDVETERMAIEALKSAVNADVVPSLKYVRHLRNKWAGHASLDRDFDPWAGADAAVSLPLVEDALVRLVSAHQRLADLIDESEVLRALAREPEIKVPVELPVTIPMTVEWGAVVPLAQVAREWAGRARRSPGRPVAVATRVRVGRRHGLAVRVGARSPQALDRRRGCALPGRTRLTRETSDRTLQNRHHPPLELGHTQQ